MMNILKRVLRKLKGTVNTKKVTGLYDFNKSNPLGGNGERVDIQLNKPVSFDNMDVYQKSHWKRYEFAKGLINNNDVCGDFACGTGYGCVLLSEKANLVIGADINSSMIEEIKNRYVNNTKVNFFAQNLLDLSYTNYFDNIISFETLEHFKEEDILKLLDIFNNALKTGGKFVFSTPYMQEQSVEAIKMGFHLTFYIDEEKIKKWMEPTGMFIESIDYQNYDSHEINRNPGKKEFIICVASKPVAVA